MRPDMSDTVIIAISQSGTTTDTNRTVDVARSRGAAVIGIVNRRNSDLTERTDGVLYTSDGRDVEMSVASTKAFYAQVAAGILLACAIADVVGAPDREGRSDLLRGLRDLPDAMQQVIAGRAAIAEAAQRLAPARRYWAVVGNGLNRVAAEEARIKLSELCYKSIACDATEDKKHIDLSSEPLILRLRGGPVGLERRRRREGSCDLPSAQSRADRDRERRRRAVQRRASGDLRARGASVAGVRAVGHGRPSLRVRGGAGHRRASPPAA